jgi:hypothetical protein
MDDEYADTLAYTAGNTDGDTKLFQSVVKLGQPKRSPTNYFAKANELAASIPASGPFPPRSFMGGRTAINIARDPKTNCGNIDHIANEFQIPDLHTAIADYLQRETSKQPHTVSGPRLSADDCPLPFTHLAVWHTVRLQQTPVHSVSDLDPARTIASFPPSSSWSHGRSDAVIFNVDSEKIWPYSGLSGELVYVNFNLAH